MRKSVLVIDTPEECMQCPLLTGADECIMQDDDTNFNADTLDEIMQTCPLRSLPEKFENEKERKLGEFEPLFKIGWNKCLEKIAEGNER